MTLGFLLILLSWSGRSADNLFKEAKTKLDNLNGIIYSNIIHAHWLVVAGYQIHKHFKLKEKHYNLSLTNLNNYRVICLPINHVRALNIMHFCSQSGNMDRAEELVREMEEDGIDAPIDVYHSMMHGYTVVQDEKKCLIVFERLKV